MTHDPDQEHHFGRNAIELPYPRRGRIHPVSPSRSNMSARPSRGPEIHHAESIEFDHSRPSRQERDSCNQRPETPQTDPLTPPISRRGSFPFDDQYNSSHLPQEDYQYDPRDYPELEGSSVLFTPPSSPGTVFNNQNPYIDHGYPPRGANNHHFQSTYNGLDVHLKKVTYPSIPGAQGRVEYYDSQWRLTDANGTVIVDEPEYVSDESQGSYYHDNETNRRHHRHIGPMGAPSKDQYTEAYDSEEQYPQINQNDGDQTPRPRHPIIQGHRDDRDTQQSHSDTLRDSYGLDPRLAHHVQANRDTGYNAPNSTATVNYAKEYRASTLGPHGQSAYENTRLNERDLSPAQSVSSFNSRYSTHSRRARHPHLAPRTYNRASSESSRESLSLVKRDRRQTRESTKTQDRSLGPFGRYNSHQHGSDRPRDRSISPSRKDRGRSDARIFSRHSSSSDDDSDYSTHRRSR